MNAQVRLGEIAVNVVRKNIKNVHLSVYPPLGKVRIAAPAHMSLDTIRVFAISKLSWIKQQQRKLRAQDRETPREYLNRESHYVWGKRYLLKIILEDSAPEVSLSHSQLLLRVRPDASQETKQTAVAHWYRAQVKEVAARVVAKWAPRMGVQVNHIYVQQMKTKWGSCNPTRRHIRLNTELAMKPRRCLEYIVVHEMAHLIEPTHNTRFVALMDKFLPNWQLRREQLNLLPVRHAEWGY